MKPSNLSKLANKLNKDYLITNQNNDEQINDLNKYHIKEGKRSIYIFYLESKYEHIIGDQDLPSDTKCDEIKDNDGDTIGYGQTKQHNRVLDKYCLKKDKCFEDDEICIQNEETKNEKLNYASQLASGIEKQNINQEAISKNKYTQNLNSIEYIKPMNETN